MQCYFFYACYQPKQACSHSIYSVTHPLLGVPWQSAPMLRLELMFLLADVLLLSSPYTLIDQLWSVSRRKRRPMFY